MAIDINIEVSNYPFRNYPLNAEEALIDLRNQLLYELGDNNKLISYVSHRISMINELFKTKIEFLEIKNNNLILTNYGKEIILPEPLTRKVIIEKQRITCNMIK